MRILKRIGWNASVRFLFLWGRLANFSFSVKAVESFRGLSSLPVIFSAHPRELSNQNRLQSSVFLFVVCFHGTCTRDLHIRRYLSSFGSEICHRGESVGRWRQNIVKEKRRGNRKASIFSGSRMESHTSVTWNQLSIVCLHNVLRHGREETGLFSAVTEEVFAIFGPNLRRW